MKILLQKLIALHQIKYQKQKISQSENQKIKTEIQNV